jgi:molybdate transport system substrate-binding protein
MFNEMVVEVPFHSSFRRSCKLCDMVGAAVLLAALVWWPSLAMAAEGLRIAVAANFIQAAKELTLVFEKESGLKVEATFASSGSLYAQIAKRRPL